MERTSSPAMWITGAVEALRQEMAAVAARERHMAEAEKLHAVLTLYGVPNLPALPWKVTKRGRPARVKEPLP